jgi:hypothetical protein
MGNPPRPAALEKHRHVTDKHRHVYDGVRELAILQSSGWKKNGVSCARINELQPEGFLVDQLAEWGVWELGQYGPLGFTITWEDYRLIVQN